jgi:opacity protein-like surface antigen
MPTRLKIFAIAAALAAGTSSAAIAQDFGHGPWSNTLSICRAGYIYYKGYCRRVAAAPRPCAAGYVYSLGYCYAAH